MRTPSPATEHALQRLRARRADLQALLQRSADAAVRAADEPAELSDFKELADHEADGAVQEAAAAQAMAELGAIDAALRRIEGGSYGICEACGEPIAPARLLAVPTAGFCARCQAAREQGAMRAT